MNENEIWLWQKLWEKEPEFALKLIIAWAKAEADIEEMMSSAAV